MKPAGKFHEQDEADIHVSESAKLQILRDIFTEIKKPLVFWEASPSNHNHGSALGPASATGDFYHANLLTSFAPKYESCHCFIYMTIKSWKNSAYAEKRRDALRLHIRQTIGFIKYA